MAITAEDRAARLARLGLAAPALQAPAASTPPATTASAEFEPLFQEAEARHGLVPGFLRSLALAEGNGQFSPTAVSPKGARGLLQVLPSTAAEFGVTDPEALFDPATNIEVAARNAAANQVRLGTTDPTLLAAAHNAGAGAVQRAQGVPPFAETQTLVERFGRTFAPPPAAAVGEETEDIAARMARLGLVPQPATTPLPPPPVTPQGQAAAAGREIGSFLRENIGELGGALAGTAAGLTLAGPAGAAAPLIVRAAPSIGSLLGSLGGVIIQRGLEEGRLPTAREAIGVTARTALGEGLGLGVRRLLQPAGPRAAARAAEVQPIFERQEVPRSVANLTGGRIARGVESFADVGFSDRIQEFRFAQREAFEAAARRLGQGLGPEQGADALGALGQAAIRTQDALLRAEADQLFAEANRLGRGIPVDVRGLKAAAQDLLRAELVDQPVASLRPPLTLFEQLGALPDTIDLIQARNIQKQLGARIAATEGINRGARRRLFREVSAALDRVGITEGGAEAAAARPVSSAGPAVAGLPATTVSGLPATTGGVPARPGATAGETPLGAPPSVGGAVIDVEQRRAIELLQEARRLERERRALLRRPDTGTQTPLARILRLDPEKVPDALFSRARLAEVRALRPLVESVDPASWQLFERHGVERLLEQEPRQLAKTLTKLGDEFLAAYFSPSTRGVLRDLATIGARAAIRSEAAEEAGRTSAEGLLRFGTPGLGLVLGSTRLLTSLTLGPAVVAQIITRPAGARLFSEGLGTPLARATTAEGAALFARLIALAQQNGASPTAPVPAPRPQRTPGLPPPPVGSLPPQRMRPTP